MRNSCLRHILEENLVVIFPNPNLKAWDHLPRFSILETNIRGEGKIKKSTRDKKRIHQLARSNFVGSPVRTLT